MTSFCILYGPSNMRCKRHSGNEIFWLFPKSTPLVWPGNGGTDFFLAIVVVSISSFINACTCHTLTMLVFASLKITLLYMYAPEDFIIVGLISFFRVLTSIWIEKRKKRITIIWFHIQKTCSKTGFSRHKKFLISNSRKMKTTFYFAKFEWGIFCTWVESVNKMCQYNDVVLL